MRAVDTAVLVLEREGINCAGVPGAAINPFYSAMRCWVRLIRYILARHVEGCGQAAYGRGLYPRKAWQSWRLHRHLRPRRNGYDHGSLSRLRLTSIPILCITGQAPRALSGQGRSFEGRYRQDRSPGLPSGRSRSWNRHWCALSRKAFRRRSRAVLVRLIDLPIDVQLAETNLDWSTLTSRWKPTSLLPRGTG